jgi:hypothetical protein
VPEVRRRIPSATSQRLHVSDIEEILIPNLGDVKSHGVDVSSALVLRLGPEAQFNDAAWSRSNSASSGVTHRSNTPTHGHAIVSR